MAKVTKETNSKKTKNSDSLDGTKHSAKKLAAYKADELFSSLLSAEQRQSIESVKVKKKKKAGTSVQSSMANSYYVAGSSDETPQIYTGDELDFDIIKHMNNAEDPVTGTLKDLKIDDGDMKRAKNYYDFSFNILGKDVHPPWAKQLWVGAMMFGEVCPCCSNKKWLDINNVPKDYIAKEMPEHLVFLEYGVCPKCKRTKWELIKEYGLKNYLQLDNVLGQRCVTADTMLLTSDGIEYIGDLASGRDRGFSPFYKQIFNGTELEHASDFYVAPKRESVHRVTLRDGGVLKGTSDHPLLTPQGFKKLSCLQEGDYVAVECNTQMWGSSVPMFDVAYKYAMAQSTKKVMGRNRLTRIKRKLGVATPEWFTLLGLWVAEGCGSVITNFDTEVNEFLERELAHTFSRHDFTNDKKKVRILGTRGHKFLEYFVGNLYVKSAGQKVPECVMRAPKLYVQAFLRGLFEGDGGVDGTTVSYCTISKRLAHELRVILLNMGFAPKLRTISTWATNGSAKQVSKPGYVLYLAGEDLTRFKHEIGFMTARKQQSLEDLIKRHDSRQLSMSFRRDKLPPSVKHELLKFIDDCELALKQVPLPNCFAGKRSADAPGVSRRLALKPQGSIGRLTLLFRKPYFWKDKSYDPNTNCKDLYDVVARLNEANVPLTKSKLMRILRQVSLFDAFIPQSLLAVKTYLSSYLDLNTQWLEVVKIERDLEVAQTYDLTLPNTHRFVGNGMVNHNSGKSSSAGGGYAPYIAHRYLTFPNLATMSKSMQASTELTMTFVSLNFNKAVGVLWTPFRKTIENSSWFKDYFSMLDFYKGKYGKELYRTSTLYMSFFHKNLRFYPSGPRSSTLRGDCLTGDTMINTGGGFVHFEELEFRKGLHPTRDIVDSPLGPKSVSHTYKKVDREIIHVKTRNGFALKGTPEHPVLVITPELDYKWVRLDAVREGMWLVSKTRMNKPLFGDNQLIDLDKATILGNFTANGYRVSISSNDEKVIRRFNRAVKSATGKAPRRARNNHKYAADDHWVRAGGRNTKGSFLDTLRSWGYDPFALSAQKQIPFSVRTAPREILHEYLEAYFSCDCGINGGATAKQKLAGGNTSPEVELSSASIKLIRQLQVILLQVYGLVGRINKVVEYKNMSRVRFVTKRYAYWQLTLTGCDAYKFVKTFKRAKLQKYKARFKDVPAGFASDRRKLPYIRKHMLDFWANLNGPMHQTLADGTKVRKSPRPLIVNGAYNDSHAAEYRFYSDKNLPRVLDFMHKVNPSLWKKVERFHRLGAHYEEVVSVKERSQKTTVYDITVPDGHAFTANGIVSHNTRIAACLVGSELVSTDKGLIRIDSPEVRGAQVPLRGELHKVTKHLVQGTKKIVRVKLSNGFWVDCTRDHLFEALMPDYTRKNLQARDLTGTYLTVELGGCFGSGDLSSYQSPPSKHTYRHDLLRAMHRLQVFTATQLSALGIRSSSKINVRMQRNGDLVRLKRRPDGFIPFSLRANLSLDYLLKRYAGGKITAKFNASIPAHDSFELGYVLGAFVADGYYNSAQEFRIGACDLVRIKLVKKYLYTLFSLDYKIHRDDSGEKTAYYLAISTANVRTFLVWLGLSPAVANTKEIPWSVLQGSKEMVHGYLCGHLVSDGTVSEYNHYVYATASRALAKQLMTLLGHCRVHSYLKYIPQNAGMYNVVVDTPFQERFKNLIVSKLPINKTKRGRVINFKEVTAETKRPATFYAPYFPATAQLNKLYYSRHILKKLLSSDRVMPFNKYPRKLLQLIDATDKDTVYLQVESVTELERSAEVFDITVHSKEHLFKIGPGVITHNCLDELGLFPLPTGNEEEDENSERANADEAHKSLMNSLTTVSATTLKLLKQGQSFAPPCVLMCVSSPISQRDKVMRLYRESKTEAGAQTILGVNMPTWEMNPDLDRDSPVIAAAYASNHEKAERDFGANPPAVHSVYIAKPTYENGLFIGGQNTHNLKYMLDQPGEIYGKLERLRTSKWPSLITIDAGHVNNSFAIIGGHFDFDTQKTVVSTVLEVMVQEARRINFSLVYKHIILPLAKDLNAIALLADQWQSVELLYRIKEDMGNNPLGKPRTLGKQHSPRRKDFDSVVSMANNRNLILPSVNEQVKQRILDGNVEDWRSEFIGRPVEHLMLQFATVKAVGEERCPEKGDGYTDDVFRAAILFASKLHEPKIFERLVEARDFNYSNGRGNQPMPVFIGRSGASSMNGLRQGLTQHLGVSNNLQAILKNNGG